MAIQKLGIDSSIFGVPPPPSYTDFGAQQAAPQPDTSFGDVAPLGGTPTVPATAQPVAPSAIAPPPQNFPWESIMAMPPIPDWYQGPVISTSEGDVMGDPYAQPPPGTPQQPAPYLPMPTGSTPLPNQFGDERDQFAPQAGYAPDGWTGITDPGSAYAKGAGNFWNLYQNYWADDRDAVLAAARMGGASDAGAGGFSFDPSQRIPNTGVSGAMAPGPTGSGPVSQSSFVSGWMNSPYPGTPAGLKAYYDAHPEFAAAGITLGGSKGDKVYGPGGAYWGDYIMSAGAGGLGKLAGDMGGGSGSSSGGLNGGIDSALMSLLSGGSTPFGNQVQQMLMNIIAGNGQTPNLTNQLQSARTDAARAMNAQLGDADAALAARGLASTHGVAQGPALGATERVAEDVGANYAAALRDIESHGLDLANANEIQALSLATGLSESQAQNILGAIGAGTNRQGVLANIALQQLSMNQDWNKFILGYGLDQQKLAEDISQGRIDNVLRLLQIFLQGAGTAAGGYY